MLAKIALVIVVLAAMGYFLFTGRQERISGSEARRLVQSGALLLDVRTPEEFAAGHLAGAVNIPLQTLDRRLAELGPKDRPIVVYCRSGHRSAHAREILRRAGFTAVHDLGAMSSW